MKDKVIFYLFIVGFAGVFLVLAAALSVELVRDIRQGKKSLTWPTVTGEVSDVFRSNNRPALEYEYSVRGRTHTGNRVAFVRRRTLQRGRGLGKYYGRDFSEGDHVRVYYDPAEPSVSVLLPGVPKSGLIVSGVVLPFLFLVGCGVLWLGFRHQPGGLNEGDRDEAV